jgi:hypothetical protein
MTKTKTTKPKEPHEVWVTFTVFVRKQGDKHPWYKHGRGETIKVNGCSHDQALYLGERELARLMAERFKIGGV